MNIFFRYLFLIIFFAFSCAHFISDSNSFSKSVTTIFNEPSYEIKIGFDGLHGTNLLGFYYIPQELINGKIADTFTNEVKSHIINLEASLVITLKDSLRFNLLYKNPLDTILKLSNGEHYTLYRNSLDAIFIGGHNDPNAKFAYCMAFLELQSKSYNFNIKNVVDISYKISGTIKGIHNSLIKINRTGKLIPERN